MRKVGKNLNRKKWGLSLGVLSLALLLGGCGQEDNPQFTNNPSNFFGFQINAVFPAYQGSNVPVTSTFTQATFSRPVDLSSLQNGGFLVKEITGTNSVVDLTQGTTVSLDATQTIATFQLGITQLNSQAQYQIQFLQSIRGVNGESLAAVNTHIFATGGYNGGFGGLSVAGAPEIIGFSTGRDSQGCFIATLEFSEDLNQAPTGMVLHKFLGLGQGQSAPVSAYPTWGGRLDSWQIDLSTDISGVPCSLNNGLYHFYLTIRAQNVIDTSGERMQGDFNSDKIVHTLFIQ